MTIAAATATNNTTATDKAPWYQAAWVQRICAWSISDLIYSMIPFYPFLKGSNFRLREHPYITSSYPILDDLLFGWPRQKAKNENL